jgi:hypothetical protein
VQQGRLPSFTFFLCDAQPLHEHLSCSTLRVTTGQAMAARRVLRRDGLPDLFFSLCGFTGLCCGGGSRSCWIGLVIDWMKFASATSRVVGPPSPQVKVAKCVPALQCPCGAWHQQQPQSHDGGARIRSVDAWCTRSPAENNTFST